MRVTLAVLLLGSFLSAQVKVKPAQNLLVITNVSIVDTRDGTLRPNHTVVIKNGRIQSVAKLGILSTSRHDRIINGSGKYLIPGLWDMHVHSAGGPAAPWDAGVIFPLYIANGITGIRDMGGDLATLQARRRQIESGELLGPKMFFAGPFLDGGQPGEYKIAVNTPEEARAAVDRLRDEHVDFIKILSDLPRDAYFAVAAEAKADKLPFVGHVPRSVSSAEASAAGQKSIEHLSGVLEACSLEEDELRKQRLAALAKGDTVAYHSVSMQTLATYDPAKAWQLFSEFTDNVTWQVPTLAWWHAISQADDATLAQDERLKYIPVGARKDWEAVRQQQTAAQLADLKKVFAQYLAMTGMLRKAGAYIMAGTDSPDPYVIPGYSLHDELELLVGAGLTPAQALQSATFYPAIFLTQLNNYGVVEKSRVADLVLLGANPLADIRNTRKIAAVIVEGHYYSRAELDGMLAHSAVLAEGRGGTAAGGR